jgi:hypothetical protein
LNSKSKNEKISRLKPLGIDLNNTSSQNIKALLFFLLFFLCLFIQFPLSQSIPGNSTTWLALAISNTYSHLISQMIRGEGLTTFFYPMKNIFAFGQGAPLLAFGFLIIKKIVLDDIWTYYFFISILFSLSAWGVYFLGRVLKGNFFPSLIGGFFFSCSNFTFANIDDPHEIFFLFPSLMMAFLFIFKESKENRYFYIAMIMGAMEIYFSVYIFFFQFFFLLPFLKGELNHKKTLLKGFILFFLISLPVVAFHLYCYLKLEIINPFDPITVIKDCSLKWKDLFAPLKDNLLYGGRVQDIQNPLFWSFIRRHAFLGILFWTLGILGIIRHGKSNSFIFWMGIFGLIFSLGPVWEFGKNLVMPSPLFWFYEKIPLFIFFRVPLRAFFFTTLALSIFATLLLSQPKFSPKTKGINFFLIIIIFLHILENCPFPMQKFSAKNLMSPPVTLLEFFKGKKDKVILDLPAKLGIEFNRSQDILFPYNRELIYMYWQTQHLQNIVNGVHGYWPKSRIDLQTIIDKIPNKRAFLGLQTLGITHIVFHKEMVLRDEIKILNQLKNYSGLKLEKEDEKLAIFTFGIL